VIQIGAHTFSVGDARRTLGHFDDLWGELVRGRDASLVAHLRAPVDRALSGIDPASAPAEALVEPLRLAWSAQLAVGPTLRSAGALPTTRTGTVAALARGSGGVPKHQVERVDVDHRGVVGDTQRTRLHHGRPFQALCLWSSEVIDDLRAEGHPIAPSLAGENITLSGLPWADVLPGVRLRIGTVLCEISSYSTPCRQNAPWFLEGDVRAMSEDRGPVSRMYATVLEPGEIAVGDRAILEP
jgi:MOSC domain-containing protein YiiM